VKPLTANGRFAMYTKQEMRSSFGLPSPNLSDSVMMLMRVVAHKSLHPTFNMPQPIKPMGRR
jgi:phage terminase large subunit